MKRLASLGLIFILSNLSAQDIKFCLTPTDKPTQMIKKFYPIIHHIEKEIKQNISIKFYPTYEKTIEAIASNKCDFSRVGPATYILVKEKNKNIKLLAMEHKNGKKTFNGVIVTHKNSNITKLEDLKDKTFAFGSSKSTIGRYLSQEALIKAGIKSSNLASFKYLNRHDKVAMAVALKIYDAGALKESTYKKYKNRGLRVISKFKNVTKPWIASSNMSNKTFLNIQNVLLKIKDKKLLKAIKESGFLPATDSEYKFVRQGMNVSLEF